MNNDKETTENIVEAVEFIPTVKPLIPKSKALFVYRFESGNFSKVKYTVTAKTYEEAVNKLKEAVSDDDITKLKLEEVVEWKIENSKTNSTT